MKPVLHDGSSGTIDFSRGTRIGTLTDCISCKVMEERNGSYELELGYAVSGKYYDDIVNGNVIVAVPSDGTNETAFDIYRVSRPIDGRVKVNARHITNRMRYCMVKPGVIDPRVTYIEKYISGQYYGDARSLLVNETPFKVDVRVTGTIATRSVTISKPRTLRDLLQGSAGSLLQTYGGEWKWNTDGAVLYENRGTVRTNGITYGKNLVDLKQEEAIENTYNAAYPFWANDDTTVVGSIQRHSSATNANLKVMLLDLSAEYETAPTVAQLNSRCQSYVNSNCRGVPNVSLTVKFAPLWMALGYQDIAGIQRIQLCDEVPVIFEQLGVTTTAKVIKTDYNVLTERYNSIELGSERLTAAKAIAKLSKAAGVSLYV